MSETITLKMFEEHKELFDLMYDSYRLVNPEDKTVIEYHENQLRETDMKCYARWGRNKPCDNCISYRSNQDGKSMIKLVSSSNCIIIIRAIPVVEKGKQFVLELMKDITDSLVYDSGNNADSKYIVNAVSELNNMIIKDHLTSLYNRRYMDDRLPIDIKNAVAQKTPLSVIFIDVDDFKRINDTYGHDVGDLVLKSTADTISSCIRNENDWVARYGGDEFFICLSNSDFSSASLISERILDTIANVTVPVNGSSIHITISLGIHTMLNKELTAADIIKIADQNMYESKHNGKRRVTASVE